ncbi:hypothetical protein BD780_000057 [Clostridium tetanomorphum]|uniref:M14 family metallopeptidase n=1 Tax=Clostridium tetanomorphum TaxID=1553 RepID=UPI0004455E4B|nr:M14 family metallocarboxypeptidase [Clostridium tetanomorphum]KAJ52083.1 zink-carboxypeptidase [Clostridium tetanomorphum DSM 665]MBP1863003.1 hypothetical protein [Clostridium tetanomorphum]NRS82832.1 hypothetical protein [Clostridium tetanomorphum]
MISKRTFRKVAASITLSLVLATSTVSYVFAAPYAPDSYYKQTPEIIQNYFPKPQEPIFTPAFTKGKENFTSHEEMMKFIYDLQKSSQYMKVAIIGETQEGKPIPLLIFSKPSYDKSADILKLGKPVVWLQGQIHGNEPAGGEAMLGVARNLAIGKFGEEVLEKVSVVILPRFNGDGSYYYDRRTSTNIDSNRDHLKFDNMETIAVHKAFNKFMPEVVVDAHEYGVESNFKSVGKKGSLTAYDVLISSAKNLNIPKEVRSVSDSLFVNNAQKQLAANKHTSHMYHTVSKKGNNFTIYEAGTDAKIGRNAYGLQPSFSFLVETRGIGIGKENFERRVMSHIITSENIIKTTADNAKLVKDTVDNARNKITKLGEKIEPSDKITIASESKNMGKSTLDIIDVETGKKVKLDVDVFSNTEGKPVVERVRPTAYILPPAYHEVAKRLSYSGVTVRKLNNAIELPVEAFKVTDKKIDTNYYEGHLRNSVTVNTSSKVVKFPKESYVFAMSQPNANIISMALEPDADDSFVKFNLIPVDINEEVPVYRYMHNNKLDTYIIELQ